MCSVSERSPSRSAAIPARTETLVHTTRAVGTVTKAMSRLRRGDCLGVRGPFGSRWPVEAARSNDVVLVAGGIGLAPLRPALYQILGQRERYGKVVLLYGARTPEDLLYRQELARWRARSDLEVYVTVDRATSRWQGNVGVVTRMVPRAPFDPMNTVALVCGPEVMMRFAILELQKRGVSDEQIFLSMERNMKCAVGLCGHCQFGSAVHLQGWPGLSVPPIEPYLHEEEILGCPGNETQTGGLEIRLLRRLSIEPARLRRRTSGRRRTVEIAFFLEARAAVCRAVRPVAGGRLHHDTARRQTHPQSPRPRYLW